MRVILSVALLIFVADRVHAYVNLSGAWAGNGGYKLAKQDLQPLNNCSTCTISANWDGTTFKLAGFKNEMIGGMLWLEGGSSDATSVSVALSQLNGPSGSVISSTGVLCAQTTDYTMHDFDILIATYTQILGMTENSWGTPVYEERDLQLKFQNPYTINGNNDAIAVTPSTWSARPNANTFMPDALVPQECFGTFTVFKSSSQGVWFDFYLQKNLNAGLYTGTITVKEGATVSTSIPINVTVYAGTLPDQPSYNYGAELSEDNLNYRMNGAAHNSQCVTAACTTTDYEGYKMMHRHRLIPFGDTVDINTSFFPSAKYQLQLNGSLFTTTYDYRGPGVNTGIPVYSIGTYGHWKDNPNWSQTNTGPFCVAVSSWGYWFQNNAPTVRSFVYLDDEPGTLTTVAKWSEWMSTMSSCQTSPYTVHSWVTSNWTSVNANAPYVDNPATTQFIATGYQQTDWQTAANKYITTGSTQGWAYNGHPSWAGTVNATEDDGISAWEGPWADYLKGVNGHFQWDINAWNISGQGSPAENPLWDTKDNHSGAKTFGYDTFPTTDTTRGHIGFTYANGDGVLIYPGTEVSTYTAASFGVLAPIASLRLKMLRRGINDYDYLTMAYKVNPSSTTSVLTGVVPSALWDINCFTYSDCSYSYGGRLWSQDPQAWESARNRLALIITGGAPVQASMEGGVKLKGSAVIK